MKPPLLLRSTFGRLRASAFHRLYRRQAATEKWRALFDKAHLGYAPGVAVSLMPSDMMHAEIAFTGAYEHRLSRLTAELAAKGGVFVDVGANVGYFSLIWVAGHRGNIAHAFEASPRNIPLLHQNVHSNYFGDRIKIYGCALGRETGPGVFDLGPEGVSGWGGLSADSSVANIVEVSVNRLDRILEGAMIDFLKIDVEGADTWVLEGANKLLNEKRIKRVWFEQNKPRMKKLGIPEDAARAFLRSVGYDARPIGNPAGETVDWMAVPV